MSAPVTLLKATLELVRPWAVGAMPFCTSEVDLPIVVDPRTPDDHRPYLPPTALVGALREHLGPELSVRWFGPEPGPAGQVTGSTPRVASPVWALGTRLSVNQHQQLVTSTAIDARRGAAAKGSLRTEQRVGAANGKPSTLEWYLSVDDHGVDELVRRLLSWQFHVGRGRSKGLGLARVATVERVALDLDKAADLTWWLTRRRDWLAGRSGATEGTQVTRESGDELRTGPVRSYDWRLSDPLAVGSGTGDRVRLGPDGGDRTQEVRALRTDPAGQPVIPGTAWKGVFRHRAEFILGAVGCADRDAIIAHLFGSGSDSSDGTQRGRRGVLRFADSRVTAPDGGRAELVERRHVGIDRITGGARPGLLFAVRAVAADAVTNQVVEADHGLPETYLNLLDHIARDLHDGLVGVGGMTTRGYGSVRLSGPVTVQPLSPQALTDALPARADKEDE